MALEHVLALTSGDVCAVLGISRTTLFRLRRDGIFPPPLPTFVEARWSREQLVDWLRHEADRANQTNRSGCAGVLAGQVLVDDVPMATRGRGRPTRREEAAAKAAGFSSVKAFRAGMVASQELQ